MMLRPCVRLMSTASTSAKANIYNKEMKQLYKKVHPDLFVKHPEIRELNSVSLSELSRCIDDNKPAKLKFYLLPDLIKVETQVNSAEGVPAFFAMCGIQVEHRESEDGAQGGSAAAGEIVPFLRDHVGGAMERLAVFRVRERHIGLHRMGLSTRGITVSFQNGASLEGERKLELLQRIVPILDQLPSLSHIEILIGKKASGVDAFGRININSDDSDDNWKECLSKVDLQDITEARRVTDERRAMERKAANTLGVAVVCAANESFALSSEYSRFLSRLEDGIQDSKKRFQELVVVVKRNTGEKGIRFEGNTVFVAVSDTPELIEGFLSEHGVHKCHSLRVLSAQKERENSMRVFVKRRLRLAGLSRSAELEVDQVREACHKLQGAAGNAIINLVQGAYIRIDNKWGVEPDGTILIKWDEI